MEQKQDAEAQQTQTPAQQSVEHGKGNPQNGAAAHAAAEADMLQDADLNDTTGPEDGLDEGELAKMEGED